MYEYMKVKKKKRESVHRAIHNKKKVSKQVSGFFSVISPLARATDVLLYSRCDVDPKKRTRDQRRRTRSTVEHERGISKSVAEFFYRKIFREIYKFWEKLNINRRGKFNLNDENYL